METNWCETWLNVTTTGPAVEVVLSTHPPLLFCKPAPLLNTQAEQATKVPPTLILLMVVAGRSVAAAIIRKCPLGMLCERVTEHVVAPEQLAVEGDPFRAAVAPPPAAPPPKPALPPTPPFPPTPWAKAREDKSRTITSRLTESAPRSDKACLFPVHLFRKLLPWSSN